MNKDLSVGRPETVLCRFCLPLLGSIIFQQLYNIADSFVAGKFIGDAALAAVGNGYEITLIFIAFAFGCNIGCSVITAQLFGAKDYARLKTAVYTTFISGGILCAALMVIGFLFCGDLLRIINTPEAVIADSKLYLDVYISGLPFVFYYNLSTGIFSALGDSRTPFCFLAASSVGNIGMDVLFVAGFGMGVSGVAWATLICQGISCALATLLMFRRLRTIPVDSKPSLFSRELFVKVSAVAVPSILQQSFVSVGNIIVQGVINSFGLSVMAGYSASVKLNNMVITAFNALGNGVSNFTAQNIGAGKSERVHRGLVAGRKLAWIICIPVMILYFFAGKWLVFLFVDDPSGGAMQTGFTMLRILSPFYPVVAAKITADGVLRGVGRMKMFMTATFTDLVLRVVLAEVLSSYFGSVGIWCAWPIGWVIATVMSLLFYRSSRKKIEAEPRSVV